MQLGVTGIVDKADTTEVRSAPVHDHRVEHGGDVDSTMHVKRRERRRQSYPDVTGVAVMDVIPIK